jgi:hypothetical protein
MAKKQELEFSIDDDGKISIKVIGAQGAECLEMTKAIEEALGIVVDRTKTSEFYQQPQKQQDQVEGKQG